MQSRGNHGKSVQWFIWTRGWIKPAPSSTSPLARVYFLGKFRQRNCFFIFYTTKKVTFECRHQFYRTCWKCHYAAVWETNSTGVIWLVWAAFPNESDLCKNNNLCNLSGASDTAFVDYDAWFFCFVLFLFSNISKRKKNWYVPLTRFMCSFQLSINKKRNWRHIIFGLLKCI